MLLIELLDIVVARCFKYKNFIGLSLMMGASNVFDKADGLANIFKSDRRNNCDDNADYCESDFYPTTRMLAKNEFVNI